MKHKLSRWVWWPSSCGSSALEQFDVLFNPDHRPFKSWHLTTILADIQSGSTYPKRSEQTSGLSRCTGRISVCAGNCLILAASQALPREGGWMHLLWMSVARHLTLRATDIFRTVPTPHPSPHPDWLLSIPTVGNLTNCRWSLTKDRSGWSGFKQLFHSPIFHEPFIAFIFSEDSNVFDLK